MTRRIRVEGDASGAGKRAKIESVREHRYATEFDPPEIPQKVTMDDVEIRPAGANPVAIKEKNIGTTVEVEPDAGENARLFNLNIAPEIVDFLGDRPIAEDLPVEVRNIVLPEFYRMTLQTNVTCFVGKQELLACFNSSRNANKRVLLFVRVDELK